MSGNGLGVQVLSMLGGPDGVGSHPPSEATFVTHEVRKAALTANTLHCHFMVAAPSGDQRELDLTLFTSGGYAWSRARRPGRRPTPNAGGGGPGLARDRGTGPGLQTIRVPTVGVVADNHVPVVVGEDGGLSDFGVVVQAHFEGKMTVPKKE